MWNFATANGWGHPNIVLERLTSRQLTEAWQWFCHRPYGAEVQQRQMAQLIMYSAAQCGKRARAADYLPFRVGVELEPEQVLSSYGAMDYIARIEAEREAAIGDHRKS